jgi:hypothetical protein
VAHWQKALVSVQLAIATVLLSISLTSFGGVGKVTEQTGPTEIIRNKKSIPSAVNTGIEMNDTISTAKSKAQLTFDDATTVKITEQSRLIIDDFVYDPAKGTGKLAMKVALGTARYASGQIAKSNPQSVSIQTPTATIAVRGTDFSMTVDELGRSMVMLLPSCDEKACVTGAISVTNDSGTVHMDVAYQATLVTSLSTPPTRPVIVRMDQMNINNMLIIDPPREIQREQSEQRGPETRNALDVNFLNKDLLKTSVLDQDVLRYNALDINFLDFDLLPNVLDQVNAALFASQDVLTAELSMLPGYDPASGLLYGIDENDKLVLTKGGTHFAQVIVGKDANLILNITQSSVPLYQRINSGGSTTITIIQK